MKQSIVMPGEGAAEEKDSIESRREMSVAVGNSMAETVSHCVIVS